MGIKNLMQIIKKHSPDSIKQKRIMDYKGKKLGIDANLMIYKVVYAIRKNGYDLKNNGIVVTHIHGIMQKLVSFKKYNIKAIFVFDGIPPKLKEETMKNRKKIRASLQLKYERAKTQDEKKRYYYHKSDIKSEEIFDVMELIKIFGFPVIESKDEADITLSQLSKHNKIDAVVTDDMDILVFGGSPLLKNFSVSEKRVFQEINLKRFLKDTKLTQNQLIDIAILIGCDYCAKQKGIGPMTAYKMIKEHRSINRMVKNDIIKQPIRYQKVKKFFKTKTKDVEKFRYREKRIDKDDLLLFLKSRSFKEKYINTLKPYLGSE